MRLYELPIALTVRFEETSSADLDVRKRKIESALLRIQRHLLTEFGLSIEWELGHSKLLAVRNALDFDED